ncbi:MAG TPA: alginate lyase family protein [Vulgatibacter sp.]|nr:alginate lyase family protein [Vulgatibacter sp.]
MQLGYLRYLAAAVPHRRLAEAAALRAWRHLKRKVTPDPIRPHPARVLSALGVSSAAELPVALRRTVPGPLALGSTQEVRDAARALRERLPEEAAAALARAEHALAGRIEVFGRDVPLRRAARAVSHASPGWEAVDWEADPWSASAGGAAERGGGRVVALRDPPDPKRQWVVGRLEDAVWLACGAALLREVEPARAADLSRAALDRMVDFAQAPCGIQWTCAMEVALRAANVAMALRLLAADPVAEARPFALLEILRSLALHLAWVQRNLEDDGAVPNNHLVADLTGLLVASALLPRLPGAASAARRAAAGLASELERQVLADGFSFEGSVGYHRLAVELFTLGELASRHAGVPLPPPSRQRLARMLRATLELHDETDPAPRFGDDDSGWAIPFAPRPFGRFGPLLALGAASLGADEFCVEPPGAEVCWLLGADALSRAKVRPAAARRDGALPRAGIYLLRSRRLTCAIACGPNGTSGLGTHGHNDKLSFELRVDGRVVVADPGSGSYTGDPALRNRLRGTASHSTVRIDGEEQQAIPPARLFALPEQARARCVSFESEAGFARFVGEHEGYRRLGGVTHRRTFHLDRRAETLSVEDWVRGDGVHLVELRFALPDEEVELRAADDEDDGTRWIAELGGGAARIEGPPQAEGRIEEGVHAAGYGQLVRSRHVVFALEAALPITLRTEIVPARAARSQPADEGEPVGAGGGEAAGATRS